MAEDNEVSIIIKAVNDASGVLKAIAKDTSILAGVATRLEKSLGKVATAQKEQVTSQKDASKAAADAAKIGLIAAKSDTERAKAAGIAAQSIAKTSTEEERAAAVLLKSQAQISQVSAQTALVNQRRLTEEQRTSKAIADEALNRASKVGKIIGDAAKADAQVAGIQIRNNAMLEKSERSKQKELEKTAKAQEKATEAVRKANAEAQKGGFDKMIEQGKEFIASWGPVIATITAIGLAAKKAFDFGQEGANLERLRVSGTELAKQFGVDMVLAVAAIKSASLDTITTQQALMATNRALMLGVASDVEGLAKLMQVATVRGRALGLTTTESFDRIVLGIGRLSTRILDDLGIIVDAETAYNNYGAAIGKTGDDLTEAEKRIALTNAIIEDSNKLLSKTGGIVFDNATKFERLSAAIQDTANEAKEAASGPIGNLSDLFFLGFFSEKTAIDITKAHIKEIQNISKSYSDYTTEVDRVIGMFAEYGHAINENGDWVKRNALGVETLILANAKLTESELAVVNSTHELSEAQKTAGAHTEQLNKILADQAAALKALHASYEGLVTTVDKLSFDQAAQSALDAAIHFEATNDEIIDMQKNFGMLDDGIIKFRADIEAAAADGEVTMEEFRKAFAPVAFAKIEAMWIQLGEDLLKIDQEATKKRLAVQADFQDEKTKDELELTRDLLDIELDRTRALEDLANESTSKGADESKKHADKMIDIERDYQRDIDKIMRKFELSRLRALIDLDARALFEAEQQRDSDLKDAKDSNKDKREDEEKDYKKKLEDLADFQKDKKDEIEKDAKRAREDARVAAQRQRDDAQTAMNQRLQDIQDDGIMRAAELKANHDAEKAIILEQLGLIQTDYRDAYDDRVKDLLDFFKTNENILRALQAGTVSIEDLRSQFSDIGGIPFGGVPFVPQPSDPVDDPEHPGTSPHPCLPGNHWDYNLSRCVPNTSFAGDTVTTEPKTIGVVRLEIRGDGALAQMVRDSAANVFAEVMAE